MTFSMDGVSRVRMMDRFSLMGFRMRMALRAASSAGCAAYPAPPFGVEGQGGGLIEALCSQQALGLELLLLRIVQAAVGNRGSVQEGGV